MPTRCAHQTDQRGTPGPSDGGRGMRGTMSIDPRAVWERLPSDLQHAILDDLSSILQEVIHEHIRTGHVSALAEESGHLHPAVHAASTDLQSGEPALAVRPPGARPTPGLARQGRGSH